MVAAIAEAVKRKPSLAKTVVAMAAKANEGQKQAAGQGLSAAIKVLSATNPAAAASVRMAAASSGDPILLASMAGTGAAQPASGTSSGGGGRAPGGEGFGISIPSSGGGGGFVSPN